MSASLPVTKTCCQSTVKINQHHNSDTVPLSNAKSCNLALGDTEGIFKQALQTTEFFSSYSCTIKSIAFKNKTKNCQSYPKHEEPSLSFLCNDEQQSCVCNRVQMSWHAGQSVLTLQVNRWEALEETTVSFQSKRTQSSHWPGITGAGMQKG